MKTIQLKKVTVDEIDVLREQIGCFVLQQNEIVNSGDKDNFDFCIGCILIDILLRLTLKLRNKTEMAVKKNFSVRLSLAETSALMVVCKRETAQLTDYQNHVLTKTRNAIDQELTNLI